MQTDLEIKNEPYKDQQEIFRIKGNKISFGVVTYLGREGDAFIVYSPSFEVSGYGNSKEEAEASFNLNITLFCKDLYTQPIKTRDSILKDLGWSRAKFHTKNYSKAYIDNDGVLQNFDAGTVERKYLEAVA